MKTYHQYHWHLVSLLLDAARLPPDAARLGALLGLQLLRLDVAQLVLSLQRLAVVLVVRLHRLRTYRRTHKYPGTCYVIGNCQQHTQTQT